MMWSYSLSGETERGETLAEIAELCQMIIFFLREFCDLVPVLSHSQMQSHDWHCAAADRPTHDSSSLITDWVSRVGITRASQRHRNLVGTGLTACVAHLVRESKPMTADAIGIKPSLGVLAIHLPLR